MTTGPRSFTVRVPHEVYLTICDLAQREGKKLNAKVNDLIAIGIGKNIQLDAQLREMLLSMTLPENASE